MCGICGEIRFRALVDPKLAVDKMLPLLERRGPDAGGAWANDGVALGHRRLSIIDLSTASAQPMLDVELSLVFNGAIYNYRELRAQLIEFGHHLHRMVIPRSFSKPIVNGVKTVLAIYMACLPLRFGMRISSSFLLHVIGLASNHFIFPCSAMGFVSRRIPKRF